MMQNLKVLEGEPHKAVVTLAPAAAAAASCTDTVTQMELLPEAAGARSHGGGAASLLVRDALGAEVLGEEVQLVRSGLEGQLV